MPDVLDAPAVRSWARRALDGLARAREEIDALNVYPVPDGDTGTNLYLTVESVVAAVDELAGDADFATTVRAVARGALLGARGNSGIILSELMRGLADAVARPPAAADGPGLAAALTRAADLGYAAVARPVEGTMLTVARRAAQAASRAADDAGDDDGCLARVTTAAAEAAGAALEETTDQLEPLRRAGVVDAGGFGLTVLLEALASVVTGVTTVGRPRRPSPVRRPAGQPPAAPAESRAPDPAYEVMYLLDADEPSVDRLRSRLADLGESLIVVGGEGLWNVHVHVDDAGAAVEAGVEAGRPHRIRVTHLAVAVTTQRGETPGGAGRAVVAVVAGDGLAELVARAGATSVHGGAGGRASTAALLDAIRRAGSCEVIVLPNDADSVTTAEAAAAQARAEGLRVAVVPAVATVQALAALAVHEPGRRFEDDVVQMTAAAGHARHGGVTVAATEAVTAAGPCRPGDVLGVVDGDFAVIGSDLAGVACTVVDRMLGGGGEIVTLVTGRQAPAGLAEAVAGHVAATRPDVDTAVYAGGQPRYPLLIGVE